MNLWIKIKPDALKKVIKRVDFLFLNDGEARQFTNMPEFLIVPPDPAVLGTEVRDDQERRARCTHVRSKYLFSAPAFPLEEVYDPTGAGDTFAGGFFGYVASQNGDLSETVLRRAVVHGSVMASFTVEKFSLERLTTLSREQLDARIRILKDLAHFDLH